MLCSLSPAAQVVEATQVMMNKGIKQGDKLISFDMTPQDLFSDFGIPEGVPNCIFDMSDLDLDCAAKNMYQHSWVFLEDI